MSFKVSTSEFYSNSHCDHGIRIVAVEPGMNTVKIQYPLQHYSGARSTRQRPWAEQLQEVIKDRSELLRELADL